MGMDMGGMLEQGRGQEVVLSDWNSEDEEESEKGGYGPCGGGTSETEEARVVQGERAKGSGAQGIWD
jgi:hypothetical protein